MNRDSTEIARITLQGDRAENQDRFAVLEENDTCLLALADGLGGHPRGEVAAQFLIDTCRQMWRTARKPLVNPSYFLQQCALRAHQAIVGWGIRQDPPITPRTTAVLALLQEGRCYWGHAGDSRFYLVRDEKIHLVSRDHIVANEPRPQDPLAEELHPATITRCLGGASQGASLVLGAPVQLQEGDIALLCSDGFWNQLDEEEMLLTLHNAVPLHNALRILGEAAEEYSIGQSDNVTAVGVRLGNLAYGIGQMPMSPNDDAELLQAIEHLNRLIDRTF